MIHPGNSPMERKSIVCRTCKYPFMVRGALFLAPAALLLLSSCSLLPRFNRKLPGNRAFIKTYPATPGGGDEIRLAVKDNIDTKGDVTTAGSELFLKTHSPAK